jgi:hypothetical protein
MLDHLLLQRGCSIGYHGLLNLCFTLSLALERIPMLLLPSPYKLLNLRILRIGVMLHWLVDLHAIRNSLINLLPLVLQVEVTFL